MSGVTRCGINIISTIFKENTYSLTYAKIKIDKVYPPVITKQLKKDFINIVIYYENITKTVVFECNCIKKN